MTESDELSGRIEAVEVRIAYQDQTIETLNETVTRQWKQIEDLRRQLAILEARLQEAERRSPGAPVDEKPPHY